MDPLSTKSGSGFIDLWIRIQPEYDEILENLRNLISFFLQKVFAKNNRVGFTVILVNFLLWSGSGTGTRWPKSSGSWSTTLCIYKTLYDTWCIQFSINLYKMREKKRFIDAINMINFDIFHTLISMMVSKKHHISQLLKSKLFDRLRVKMIPTALRPYIKNLKR